MLSMGRGWNVGRVKVLVFRKNRDEGNGRDRRQKSRPGVLAMRELSKMVLSGRLRLLVILGCVCLVGAACSTSVRTAAPTKQPASANWPTRRVEMVYPFGAGTPGDVLARKLAAAITPFLKQSMEVVDVPGAAGAIGISQVVHAAPNGYVIGFAPIATLAVQPHLARVPYGGPGSYSAVATLANPINVLMVSGSSPWRTLPEFTQYAKANPGKVSVGTTGKGTIPDIYSRLLARDAGYQVTDIPFPGEPQAIAAVLGNHVTATVIGLSAALPYVKNGTGRVLTLFDQGPSSALPGVPPVSKYHYDAYEPVPNFVIAPPGTPKGIVADLAKALLAAMKVPTVRDFLSTEGWAVTPAGPEATAQAIKAEFTAFGKITAELGLSPKG